MADDFADRLSAANRVSIRAVLAPQGQDVQQALLDNGITDPVTIPVALDDGTPESAAVLGNGMTPNIRGTLDLNGADPATSGGLMWNAPPRSQSQPEPPPAATTTTPAAYGLRALAPIRPR